MKKTSILVIAFYCLIQPPAMSQSVAINKTGAAAHTSAILDIQSTEKGLLIPRMTRAQKYAIASPAAALMVYQTDFEKGFYYNAGSPLLPFWKEIAADAFPEGTIVMSDIFPNTGLETVGFKPYGMMDENKVAEYGDYGKWTAANNNCPIADNYPDVAAVWTGTEAIYWGGGTTDNDGARYNPATDAWTYIPASATLPGRTNYTPIWTGTEMIIWGGKNGNSKLGGGARYNPNTNSWTQMSAVNAPSPRSEYHAFWTGTEMIIWGGKDESENKINNGAKYNPATNIWTMIGVIGAPEPRVGEAIIFTGSKMIVWGGRLHNMASADQLNTGAIYNPVSNSWMPTSTIFAPTKRQNFHATWNGTEMLIYAGFHIKDPICFNCLPTTEYLYDGGRYNPATNTWTTMNTTGAPENQKNAIFRNLYTGEGWIVFHDQTGKVYNTAANTWTDMGNYFIPEGQNGPSIIANAGNVAIIWGSYNYSGGVYTYFQSGAAWYNTGHAWNNKMSSYNAPLRSTTTPLWTGTELLVFGQTGNASPAGAIRLGRYNPSQKSFGVKESKTMYLYRKN